MDYYSGKRPSKKMIAQYRSWKVMEDYFGIKQHPTATYVSFNWRNFFPPELVKEMDIIIKKAKERWEEMAKLN